MYNCGRVISSNSQGDFSHTIYCVQGGDADAHSQLMECICLIVTLIAAVINRGVSKNYKMYMMAN